MDDKEQKKIFSSNLLYYLGDTPQIDVAKAIGVSPQTFNTWVKGIALPRMGKVQLLADYFKIQKSDLIDERVVPKPSSTPLTGTCIRIPVLGRVAAGAPIEAIEEIIDYEEIDDQLAAIGDLFGLKIKGDSMTPRICDGDVVVVHKQPTAESGEVVIATVNGDDAICKRLMIYGSAVLLRSNNPAYEDIDVTGREDFRIIGKVVELRGKSRF